MLSLLQLRRGPAVVTGDDAIARLLPDPPPPRASRREAAIGAAMRRFDGEEAAAPVASPGPAWQRPAWSRLSRAQIGAFASIALVAVVGIPLALTSLHERYPAPSESAPPRAAAGQAAQAPAAKGEASTPVAAPSQRAEAHQRAVAPSSLAEAEPAAPAVVPPPEPIDDCGKGDCLAGVVDPRDRADSFAAKAEPQLAPEPSPRREIAVMGRAARPAAAPPSAEAYDESASADLIVTGSRRTRPAASYRRGDWNACTVNDPGQSLSGCKTFVDPGARGAAGQAAAHVSDGLSRAWNNDLEGAISAFDAALALQPRSAFAYLNRGLAYQRLGEPERALADLNRAVRYAPYAARGYYNRSLLFRQNGDIERARADEERAVARDPRYRAVVE